MPGHGGTSSCTSSQGSLQTFSSDWSARSPCENTCGPLIGYGSANENIVNRTCTLYLKPLLSSSPAPSHLSNPTSRMLHLYSKMGKAIDQLDYFTQNDWKVSGLHCRFVICLYRSFLLPSLSPPSLLSTVVSHQP